MNVPAIPVLMEQPVSTFSMAISATVPMGLLAPFVKQVSSLLYAKPFIEKAYTLLYYAVHA